MIKMPPNQALIGLHDDLVGTVKKYLEMCEYEVTIVDSEPEMVKAIGLSQDSALDVPPTNPFQVYVMDANLGDPGSDDYGPAQRFYQHIKHSVEKGDAKFMAISGNKKLVTKAKEELPCMDKEDLVEFLSSLSE